MSSKPTVTLTLAGDEKKLTESFDRVGASAREMGNKVGSASNDMDKAGRGFEGLAEKSDAAETKSQGFADVLSGVTDGLSAWGDESLSTTEKLQALGMAGADLAGGLTNFLLPAMGSIAGFMKGGLASAMTFISAHPLLITLGLLAAAFVLLWTQSEAFRNIVIGVFNAVAGFARNVFGGAIQWIVDRWNDVVGFFSGLPDRIGRAFGSLGRVIGDAFNGAFNFGIDAINWFIRRANDAIYGINVINPFSNIPYLPQIARLHRGGVVPGAMGSERLAILQAGETVIPAKQSGGGEQVAVVFTGNTDTAFASAFQELVRDGTIQIVTVT